MRRKVILLELVFIYIIFRVYLYFFNKYSILITMKFNYIYIYQLIKRYFLRQIKDVQVYGYAKGYGTFHKKSKSKRILTNVYYTLKFLCKKIKKK